MIRPFLDTFMSQHWGDLLLLHWPVPAEILRPTIPDDLELDLYKGESWASVVGFHLSDLRIRPARWIPWGNFNEVNLRTYVCTAEGKKGVWFHSLDSTDLFAVAGANVLYGLNYRFASISQSKTGKSLVYNSCTRSISSKVPSRLQGQINNISKTSHPAEDPLDRFLLERYRFWAQHSLQKQVSSAAVRHRPYDGFRLDNACYTGELFQSQGMPEPSETPTVAHYCKGFSVEASAPQWAYVMAGQANHRKT